MNPSVSEEPSTSTALSPCQQSARAKALAAEYGFALSGVALLPPDGQTPRHAAYETWLKNGFQGPLDYMLKSQPARSRLSQRLPWARSVLALAAFYDGAAQGERGRDLAAHVARYARGRDYHLVFERRLKALSRALVAEGVCGRARWYTDTGPVLERAWAEAAGVGWIGKNTCLIHPRLGSFLLLAEIVLDSTPAPDPPAADHCGTCRRCLDACPTQAFPAPGVLDAQRCLVTWNIERHGDTPKDLWASQGEWAAGCDICQTVCPYNAPPRGAAPDAELSAPLPWQKMTLAECIVMTQAQYDRAFAASALRRAGLMGLRLGAITVAGNLKLSDCREALEQCEGDRDADIRERAKWAMMVMCES